MAITLLTSVPGGGKTSFAVQNIILKAHNEGKIIYTCGIPKLKIPTIELTYEQIRHWSETRQNDKDLPELVNIEHNSIIVIDEVQKLWPAMGSKKTKDIEDLSEHRHYGLTFFIITQSPKLISRYVLALIDKHLHIRSTWAGRKLYEWSEYCSNPTAKTNRDLAVTSNYSLPKNAFSLYHSATAHIKPTKRVPAALFVLVFAVGIVLYFGHSVASRHMSSPEPEPIPQAAETQPFEPQTMVIESAPAPVQVEVKKPIFSTQLLTDNIDWTRVSACLENDSSCICYGRSGERLVVPLDSCQLAVRHGWPKS
jgi:zona occludens toxin